MIIRLLAVLLLFSAPAFSWENDTTGTLTGVEGAVTIRASIDSDPVSAAIGMPIHNDDIVETGPDSRAQIVFLDDTTVTLGANAKLRLNPYDLGPTVKPGQSYYEITGGSFLFESGITPMKTRTIKTDYGVISPRAAKIWSGLFDDAPSLYVIDGEASLETKRGRVIARKELGTSVHGLNGRPDNPKAWSAEKIAAATETVTFKDAQPVIDRMTALKAEQAKARPTPEPAKEPIKEEKKPENILPPVPEPATGFEEEDAEPAPPEPESTDAPL